LSHPIVHTNISKVFFLILLSTKSIYCSGFRRRAITHKRRWHTDAVMGHMATLTNATSCKAHEVHFPFLPWPCFHFENRSTGAHSPGVGPHLIVVVAVLRVIMGSAASRKRFEYTDIGYMPEVRVCVNRNYGYLNLVCRLNTSHHGMSYQDIVKCG
jgi:hypothetical protein